MMILRKTLVFSKSQGHRQGFLARLARDCRGNALAIMAAALVPLAGMIGSGLDMARAYMTKAKLQTACDASALAARRYMAGGALNQDAIDEGTRFFNFNFPPGTMEATPVNLSIQASADDASVVEVSAATAVPTTVMALFGQRSIAVDVSCSADQDYVNNDIMLVLDVTGSMNCMAGTGCIYAASEQSNSRLSRLRTAATALYRALDGAAGVRTRYGFMPYSMTVNVGADLNAGWLRNPASYWTRPSGPWVRSSVNHPSSWFTSGWTGCVEERSTISQNGQSSIRISSDVAQADIDTVSSVDQRLQWQPYDDVATTGETDAFANLARFCPARASRLAVYDSESAFQSQVNASLAAVGGYTNHDVGIMWGMRYLSATGMFAADNPTMFNNIRVDRHIVFLTDGTMTASTTNYSAFGIPAAEQRMTGSGDLVARHNARFLNACNRARQMGMTVWVIALDVGSTAEISQCASGNDHFFVSDGSDLEQVFDLIGRGIGRLRITR